MIQFQFNITGLYKREVGQSGISTVNMTYIIRGILREYSVSQAGQSLKHDKIDNDFRKPTLQIIETAFTNPRINYLPECLLDYNLYEITQSVKMFYNFVLENMYSNNI